jgi:hypothetical protein
MKKQLGLKSILTAVTLSLLVVTQSTSARVMTELLDDVTRTAAKVADNVPVKQSDELMERLGKAAGKITKSSDEILIILKKGLSQNPTLLRQVDQLDGPGRKMTLIMVEGGESLAKNVPDLATRSQFIRAGGADLVASAGMYGDDFVKNTMRLNTALDAGTLQKSLAKLPSGISAAKKTITLSDFTATIGKWGGASVDFFNNKIMPNWKVLAGSGVVAWWILDPGDFQDTAGNITEEGIKRITLLAGEVAARGMEGAIKGTGEGMKIVTENVWTSFKDQGTYGVVGVIVLLAFGSLAFRRVRYYVLAPFRWLNKSPDDDE